MEMKMGKGMGVWVVLFGFEILHFGGRCLDLEHGLLGCWEFQWFFII